MMKVIQYNQKVSTNQPERRQKNGCLYMLDKERFACNGKKKEPKIIQTGTVPPLSVHFPNEIKSLNVIAQVPPLAPFQS